MRRLKGEPWTRHGRSRNRTCRWLGRPGDPEADGEDFIRHLQRSSVSRSGRIPILAFTGHVTAADRDRALAAGFDAFLAKPASPYQLFEALLSLVASPPKPGGRAKGER